MTITTAWAHLPNATHIDRVLEHVTAHPDNWDAARGATRGATRSAAWGVAREAKRGVAWAAVGCAVWDAVWDAAWGSAWDATHALIAWDDCLYILDLPADAVRTLAVGGNHAAALLLPAVLAMGETS